MARTPSRAHARSAPANSATVQYVGWGLYGLLVVVGLGFGVFTGTQQGKTIEVTKSDGNPPKDSTPAPDTTPPAVRPPAATPPVTPPAVKPPESTPIAVAPKKEEKKEPTAVTPPKKKPEPVAVTPKKETKPEPPMTVATSLTFDKDIKPIFMEKCNSCHGNPPKKPGGGLDLRSMMAIKVGGGSGTGIIPGKPMDSPVWQRIEDGSMPEGKSPKLTDMEMKAIREWIAGGAK